MTSLLYFDIILTEHFGILSDADICAIICQENDFIER